jgi:hypothetical protein
MPFVRRSYTPDSAKAVLIGVSVPYQIRPREPAPSMAGYPVGTLKSLFALRRAGLGNTRDSGAPRLPHRFGAPTLRLAPTQH